MLIELGLIYGGIAMAGAMWRGYKGYQSHRKKRNYEAFSWQKYIISIAPAASAGFIAGSTYSPFPDFLTSAGITLAIMFFTGGIGIASFQSKLPGSKK